MLKNISLSQKHNTVDAFYRELNRSFSEGTLSRDSTLVKSELIVFLTKFLRIRFSGKEDAKDSVAFSQRTFQKMCIYLDRLSPSLQPHFRAALAEYFVNELTPVVAASNRKSQGALWTDRFAVFVNAHFVDKSVVESTWSALNSAVLLHQGVSRIEAMRAVFSENPEIRTGLEFAVRVLRGMYQDPEGNTPSQIQAVFAGSFLHGATVETVGFFLRFSPFLFSNQQIKMPVLGENPSPSLEHAYLNLMTGRVSPSQVDLLRDCLSRMGEDQMDLLKSDETSYGVQFSSPTKQRVSGQQMVNPMFLNLVYHAESQYKQAEISATLQPSECGAKFNLIEGLRNKIPTSLSMRNPEDRSFDRKPLIELITWLALCPEYRPKEADIAWFKTLDRHHQGRLTQNLTKWLSPSLTHLEPVLQDIFSKSTAFVPRGFSRMGSPERLPMGASPFRKQPILDSSSLVDGHDFDSLSNRFREDVSERSFASESTMPQSVFGLTRRAHTSKERDIHDLITSYNQSIMASKPDRFIDDVYIAEIADYADPSIADHNLRNESDWLFFNDKLTDFFLTIMAPSVFQVERTPETILSELKPFLRDHLEPVVVLRSILSVSDDLALTPENKSKFDHAMQGVFGGMPAYKLAALGQIGLDLETVFEPFQPRSGHDFIFSTQIERDLITSFFNDPSHILKSLEILRRDRLPSRLADAYIGYAALVVLRAHLAEQQLTTNFSFSRVCEEFRIDGPGDLVQRLKNFGRSISDLILTESSGLTTVEKTALQKLKNYYRKNLLAALTTSGEFSAFLGLDKSEEKTLQGLFSQKKKSAETMLKFFFYSGLYDYISHDMSVYQTKIGGKEAVSRVLEEDVRTVRDTHLTIYSHALRELLENSTLTRTDKEKVRAEIRLVARDIFSSVTMHDTSTSVKTAKKSLSEVLGKKGNIAFTRQRFTDLLATLDTKKQLNINPKKKLQRFTETAINEQRPWLKKTSKVGGLTSVITPSNVSARMSGVRNTVMESRGTKGVGCQSNLACTTAAANNQITELFQDGRLLFSGVRHGIVATQADPSDVYVAISESHLPISELSSAKIDTYLNENSHIMSAESRQELQALGSEKLDEKRRFLAKHVGNYAKAKDLLRSAMLQQIKVHQLHKKPHWDAQNKLHVELVSISLVTPDDIRPMLEDGYHEKQMLEEQAEALARLSHMPLSEKSALLAEFVDDGGQPLFSAENPPELSLGISTFNFGVNEREYAGRVNQRPKNELGMMRFTTGYSGLKIASEGRGSYSTSPVSEHAFLEKLHAHVSIFFSDYQTLTTLSMSKQANPYEMPVLLAVLANACGASVLFNCKSGKDRTSLMDVMVKIFMRQLESSGDDGSLSDIDGNINYAPYFGYFQRLDRLYEAQASGANETEIRWLKQQQKANREMLFNSGNREVQEENTTAWGYKLEGENTARMFAAVFGITNMGDVYGFSKLIEA